MDEEVLFRDELAVIARPGHPCLENGAPGLDQLLWWPWVIPLPNTPARAALDRAFAAKGLAAPPDHVQATSASFSRSIVSSTDYLASASRGQARKDERAGILRIVPVDLSGTAREIGIALRAGSQPSPDMQALVEALRVEAAALGS